MFAWQCKPENVFSSLLGRTPPNMILEKDLGYTNKSSKRTHQSRLWRYDTDKKELGLIIRKVLGLGETISLMLFGTHPDRQKFSCSICHI
jgi:hypothetical protein